MSNSTTSQPQREQPQHDTKQGDNKQGSDQKSGAGSQPEKK